MPSRNRREKPLKIYITTQNIKEKISFSRYYINVLSFQIQTFSKCALVHIQLSSALCVLSLPTMLLHQFFKIATSYLRQEPTKLKHEGYQMLEEGLLTYRNRLYIPNCDDLKRFIMDEIHKRPYTRYPGYQKMIMNTRKQFYWHGLNKYIANSLAKCLEFQQVKEEH
jgi:hypothetical protein